MTAPMIWLGFKELTARWRTTAGMVAGVGVALLVFLALESITNGAAAAFAPPAEANWIVQQKGSMGEFAGSRLPGEYVDRLKALGASAVVGEIHTAAGTSFEDLMLVRGVPPESYTTVERFTLIAGEALAPGDQHMAMVGRSLAESKGWNVADAITVQGREFRIKGIFHIGTLADSEIWLPLAEAQGLFGFGSDVSIYVVRGDEALPGVIETALPVEVAREGEGLQSFNRSLEAMVRILRVVSGVMGVAAALGILNVMFTLVRTRRREMAVLRSIGFGRRELIVYVLGQAATVAAAGYGLALLAALALLRGLDFQTFGITISPRLDLRIAGLALVWSLAIGLVAGAFPASLAARLNLAETLRGE